MPLRLTLIYVICCLIDAAVFSFHKKWLFICSSLPVLSLMVFYILGRKGEYKLKDYTYISGLAIAAISDYVFEFRSLTAKVISMVLYVFSFSFYLAVIRKEAVFVVTLKERLKLVLHLVIIQFPFFFVSSKIPLDYFFSSIIYMVFLSLLYINALMRKTYKSSYRWFLAGALAFVLITVFDIYFAFVIKVPYGDLITKLIYQFAQFAIFMGVIKTYNNFYVSVRN